MSKKIKILPIFIICAFLMFSVKIGNVIQGNFGFSISQNQAISQENPEVVEDVSMVEEISAEDNFTKVEVEILQDLAKRREVLDAKSAELDKRAFELDLANQEIDKKIAQMKDYEQRLSKLVKEYNQEEKERIVNLIKVYSAMKPKDAAQIFDTLDLKILVMLFSEMKPTTSSAILAQMNPNIAKEVTKAMVGNGVLKY